MTLLIVPARDLHVRGVRITSDSDLASAQRMPCAHDPDIAIPKQRLRAHFGSDRLVDDSRLQIHRAVSQRAAGLVQFVHEMQSHFRRLLRDASHERRAKILDEAFARTDRECSVDLLEIELARRPQCCLGGVNDLADRVAQFHRAR